MGVFDVKDEYSALVQLRVTTHLARHEICKSWGKDSMLAGDYMSHSRGVGRVGFVIAQPDRVVLSPQRNLLTPKTARVRSRPWLGLLGTLLLASTTGPRSR